MHAGPGLVALVVGTISALLGILYATTDNDLKTMLAHSSIENVGIIIAGFGAGMVFVATNHPALAAIALSRLCIISSITRFTKRCCFLA